jgi:hypothetical protein
MPKLISGHRDTRVAFAEEALIDRLMASEQPLSAVGAGLSERVVEIPWVLRSLPPHPSTRVLDVGTAFAPTIYKRLLMRQPQAIEAVDLGDVDVPSIPSHVADVRRLPFAAGTFDVVTCISTLEHIGMDNERYSIDSHGGGDIEALRELGRVARRILVTVPAGGDEDHGWLRQYAPATFRQRVARAHLSVARLEVFAHDAARGWAIVGEDSVSDCHFGQGVYAAAAVICADLRPQP